MIEEREVTANDALVSVLARFAIMGSEIRVNYTVYAIQRRVLLLDALPDRAGRGAVWARERAWTSFAAPATFRIARGLAPMPPGRLTVFAPVIPWLRAIDVGTSVEGSIDVCAEECGPYDLEQVDRPRSIARRLVLALDYALDDDVRYVPVAGMRNLFALKRGRSRAWVPRRIEVGVDVTSWVNVKRRGVPKVLRDLRELQARGRADSRRA